MVLAETKYEARKIVSEDHGYEFPLHHKGSSELTDPFMIMVTHIPHYDYRYDLGFIRTCGVCGKEFDPCTNINDTTDDYSGWKYCSDVCYNNGNTRWGRILENKTTMLHSLVRFPLRVPVIYRIHNRENGKNYIGQTRQHFTIRWYDHANKTHNHKLRKDMEDFPATAWLFEVLEEVKDSIREDGSCDTKFVATREAHWINHYDAIESGYNVVMPGTKNPNP